MEHKKAVDIMEALLTISEATGSKVQEIAGSIGLINAEGFEKLKIASELYKEFIESDIAKRGEMLGIEITHYEKH